MRSLSSPCLTLDSRLGKDERLALSDARPPGLHNHNSKHHMIADRRRS